MKTENLKLLQEANTAIKMLYATLVLLSFVNMFIVLQGGAPGFDIDTGSVIFCIIMISIVHSKILKVLKSESA